MTREERAVLTFQITGVALITLGLSYTGHYYRLASRGIAQLAEAVSPDNAWALIGASAFQLFEMAALALVCILLARPLARRFLLSGSEPATPAEEALRAGFFLTAVHLLAVTLMVTGSVLYEAAQPGPLPNPAASVLSIAVLAMATILVADRPFAVRLARPRPGPRGLLAAGVLILCLTMAFYGLVWLSGFLRTQMPEGHITPRDPGLILRRMSVGQILAAFILAGLVAALRTPLSRLGLPRAQGEGEGRPASDNSLRPRTVLIAAVGIAGAWLAAPLVWRLAAACPLQLSGEFGLAALLWMAVLPLAAVLAASFAFGWIARRLLPLGPREAQAVGPLPLRAVLAVDAGLTVVLVGGVVQRLCLPLPSTLHWVFGPDGGLEWEPAKYAVAAAPVLAFLVLLLFRSDLTRAFCGCRDAPEAGRIRRARALQPWIFLLGIWLLISHGPRIAYLWAGAGRLLGRTPVLADFRPLAGLILIFAAGPLSRLLSYGPIIPRIWRPAAGQGGVAMHFAADDEDEHE